MAVKTSWSSGDVLTAADLTDTFAAKLDDPGAWTAYTPTLTASGTNPSLGTGSSALGYWAQYGKLIVARFSFNFGTSGAAAGSGTYSISLPVAATSSGGALSHTNGDFFLYDASASAAWAGLVAEIVGTALTPIFYSAGGGLASLGASTPWAWSNFDQIRGFVIYEGA